MKLSAIEKETIIIFNELDETAEVFTYNKNLITSLKKLSKERPKEVELRKENEEGEITFIVPKEWLRFKPRKKINFSEETRKQYSERMKKLRAGM